MKITFLGTASGKPSKYRNVTSIAIELDDSQYILIDCGEGTQSQILNLTVFKLIMDPYNILIVLHKER